MTFAGKGHPVRFGDFELDPTSGELRRCDPDGPLNGIVRLQDQPFQILRLLLARPGQVVSRDELRAALWPEDTFVDFEHSLNAAIKRLRDALGDSAEAPRYIETIPRRGYRFIAPVDSRGATAAAATVEIPNRPSATSRYRRIAFAAVALPALVFAWMIARPVEDSQPQDAGSSTLIRVTSDPGLTTQPTLSADAELLAYASDRSGDGNLDIWLQRVRGGDPIRLTRDRADEDQPSLSPDGTRIAFCSTRDGGGVYVMQAHSGGDARLVASGGRRPRFSPDGQSLAYHVGVDIARPSGDPHSAGINSLYVVSAAGGTPRRLAANFGSALGGIWSPDSKRLLFWGRPSEKEPGDWWVVPFDGGVPVRTRLLDALQRRKIWIDMVVVEAWPETNRLLLSGYDRDTPDVWEWSLSPETWQAGEGRRLTTGAGGYLHPAAARGLVVMSAQTLAVDLWSLPIAREEGRVTGSLQRLTASAALKDFPAVSADGRTIGYRAHAGGLAFEVWVKNLTTGVETRIVPPSPLHWLVLRPDGARVLYNRFRPRPSVIEAVATQGGAAERLCAAGCGLPLDWSHDGRWVLYHDRPEGRMRIAALDLATGAAVPLYRHPEHGLYQSHFSSDGRWVVFMEVVEGTSKSRLWAAPFRGAPVPSSEWVPLTPGDIFDDKPRWSYDGSVLYFVSERDGFKCIWAQPVDPASKDPVGSAFAVQHFHNARLSIRNAPIAGQEISVARDRIVFNMGELTGNIWSLPLDAGSNGSR